MRNLATFMIAAALVGGTGMADASQITNNTGISGATSTITFSEVALAPMNSVTNQYAAYGASFSPAMTFRPQDGFYATDYIGNFDAAGVANPFTINFGGLVSGAAFDFISNPGTSFFEALLGTTLVESFTAATDITVGSYYGFDDIVFDAIRVTVGGVNGAMEMDNLQIRAGAVPEPTSVALLGLGLVALGLGRRNRR